MKVSQPRRIESVGIIGSGNWGTAVAKIVGENINKQGGGSFKSEVFMWVREEEVEGKKLSEIINHQHQNIKYLPGIDLPHTVIAETDIKKVALISTILIVVVPHQV